MSELLQISLSCAVPLWIHKLKQRPWSEIQENVPRCVEQIANHGDVILYRGGKKGETAAAFNALAEAIAILSFCPGGVKAFGSHWESKHEGGQ